MQHLRYVIINARDENGAVWLLASSAAGVFIDTTGSSGGSGFGSE